MTNRAATPLRLHVADLLRRSGERRDVELAAPLGELAVSGSHVPEGAEITLRLHLESVPNAIVVTGTAGAPWVGVCRRCLRDVAGTVESWMQEIFETTPVEGETWPLEGDQIDVEPVARETVLLELPLVPLCQDDCQGLCAECGVDRNEVDCGHTIDRSDPRWAALDQLRFDN